jgi:hypothetical protein
MARPKKVKIKAPESQEEPPYLFSLSLGNEDYIGRGYTLLDALKAVPVPVKIVSKGLLRITSGAKKFEQMWQPSRIKRIFQPLSQLVQVKMLERLMK